MPSGAGGLGGQFPAQQQGKINTYAGRGQIPDGHLRVVVQSEGGVDDDGNAGDGTARAPPSYTDVVKGDHKIQRD